MGRSSSSSSEHCSLLTVVVDGWRSIGCIVQYATLNLACRYSVGDVTRCSLVCVMKYFALVNEMLLLIIVMRYKVLLDKSYREDV